MRFPDLSIVLPLLVLSIPAASGQSESTVKLRGSSESLQESADVTPQSERPNFSLVAKASSDCHDLPKSSCTSSQDVDGESCWWCEAGAIPSACYSESQARSLPPGVFECSGPEGDEEAVVEEGTADDTDTDAEAEANDVRDVELTSSEFSFVPSTTHVLTDGPVDPELCDPSSPLSMSGYMDVKGSEYDENGSDKHLFFWFFEKRTASKEDAAEEGSLDEDRDEDEDENENADPESVPLIVWLTGGPGCSSTLALLSENGPCSVAKGGHSTVVNPYSWIETGHVLWLDQPAGVGYSYGKENDSNEAMVSEDAYFFLQAFFKKHPEYASSPLYVVGESYGGHYAPAIAHKVFVENQKLAEERAGGKKSIEINLAGLGVGNGLTNPSEQYKVR